jgi:ParB/RepB/Spo0J family partition protein
MGKLQDRLKSKTQGIAREKEAAPAGPAEAAPIPEASEQSAPPSAPVTPIRSQPTTMPGQLAAFRNEALKYTSQIAERDAIIDELKNSTDRVQRIPLSEVDDSPFQPRLEYNPEEIDALAKTMAAGSQADPIKVRKVNGRYELISGHRRKRAALSIGWTEIDALVEHRTDDEAELESMLLVVGNVKLSDYEYAKMYRRALDKEYCKSIREAANMFGVTHPAVSGCLDMLELPKPIVDMLESKPSLFSYTTSNVIKALVKEYPKHSDIIVQGARRLVDGAAKQNSLKGWILQAIAQQTRKAKPKQSTRTITRDGHEVFTTKKAENAVTVSIKSHDLDGDRFEKDLHQWLNEYANRSE